MSLLTLLILASLVAAVAFFLAGLLLAPRRAGGAVAPAITVQAEAASDDAENLRRECVAAAAKAAEAKARCQAAEAERDEARAQAERLAAKDKTLNERLRVAEEQNRAAFEREEKVAEAWASQLAASQAEQKREDQGLLREVEKLRAQAEQERAERDRLAEAAEAASRREQAALARLQAGEAAAQARLAEAERGLRAELAAAQATLAETDRRLRAEVAAAEAAGSARMAESAAGLQARATAAEAALRAKVEAGEASLRTQAAAAAEARASLAAVEAERARLDAEVARGRSERQAAEEARQEFELRMRAAEEVVLMLRAEAAAAKEVQKLATEHAKERERLAQENAELREQQARSEREAKQQASREEESRDARVELAAAQAKLAELASLTEENRRLRDEVGELRMHAEASGELERLTAAHKQVRLDAELMARRLQELLHDQAELGPLRAQAAEAAALAQEVEYLRRREKDLEAQLYASGAYASREMRALTGEVPVVTPVSDLETNLSALVGEGGPRTAVLADKQGFLIAAAGESVAEEGLAAFAAVAGDLVARARMLLPLADVHSLRLTDANRMVLTCHLFDSAGEGLGIATLGPGEPKAESTARAIAGLATIVSGPPTADEETPAPAEITPEPAS
jgi:chromosome segregation ATPase